jgi:hypothetical protein
MHTSGADSSPVRVRQSPQYDGDSGRGRHDLGSLSGAPHSTCFPSCRLFLSFHFGFWIRGPLSSIFSLASFLPPPQPYLTFVVLCFPVLLPLYIIRSAALYISVALSHAYGSYRLWYKLVIVYTRL